MISREFVKASGVPKLYSIIRYAINAIMHVPDLKVHGSDVLVYASKALTAICNIETGNV